MKNVTRISIAALTLATASIAHAAPVLRTEIAVENAIVTVGDMFADAGINAERALFRAPAPGTSGAVSIEAVRVAAKRAGIVEFDSPAVSRIRVERKGVPVDLMMIETLIQNDLHARGIVTGGTKAKITYDQPFPTINAATGSDPVRMKALRYAPGSGNFSATFAIAGFEKDITMNGRVDLMIDAPHLVASLASGTIIKPDHIEMRPVQLRYAENGGLATFDQLVGKELKRPARKGMMIRDTDVAPPELVKRSELVTLFYKSGPLSLTVKGQALNAAAEGEAVAVLNLVSKKIVHGVATDRGTVEMVSPHSRATGAKS